MLEEKGNAVPSGPSDASSTDLKDKVEQVMKTVHNKSKNDILLVLRSCEDADDVVGTAISQLISPDGGQECFKERDIHGKKMKKEQGSCSKGSTECKEENKQGGTIVISMEESCEVKSLAVTSNEDTQIASETGSTSTLVREEGESFNSNFVHVMACSQQTVDRQGADELDQIQQTREFEHLPVTQAAGDSNCATRDQVMAEDNQPTESPVKSSPPPPPSSVEAMPGHMTSNTSTRRMEGVRRNGKPFKRSMKKQRPPKRIRDRLKQLAEGAHDDSLLTLEHRRYSNMISGSGQMGVKEELHLLEQREGVVDNEAQSGLDSPSGSPGMTNSHHSTRRQKSAGLLQAGGLIPTFHGLHPILRPQRLSRRPRFRSSESSISRGSTPPEPSLRKLVKDLHRCDVSLMRYLQSLNEQCDQAIHSLKRVFTTIRIGLNTREEDIFQDIQSVRQTAAFILQRRKVTALTLRQLIESANQLEEPQIQELKQQLKLFVADRRVDEEIGTVYRFFADPDDLLPHVMSFGRVPSVQLFYNSWNENPRESVEKKAIRVQLPDQPLPSGDSTPAEQQQTEECQEEVAAHPDTPQQTPPSLSPAPEVKERMATPTLVPQSSPVHSPLLSPEPSPSPLPASPLPTFPASPSPTPPASPSHTSPASPSPTSPASPSPTSPASPLPTSPASPSPTSPASPSPTSPASPSPTSPASPFPTSPASPSPTSPACAAEDIPEVLCSDVDIKVTMGSEYPAGEEDEKGSDPVNDHEESPERQEEEEEEMDEEGEVTPEYEDDEFGRRRKYTPKELAAIQARVRESLEQQGVCLYDPFTGKVNRPPHLDPSKRRKTATQLRREKKKRQLDRERRHRDSSERAERNQDSRRPPLPACVHEDSGIATSESTSGQEESSRGRPHTHHAPTTPIKPSSLPQKPTRHKKSKPVVIIHKHPTRGSSYHRTYTAAHSSCDHMTKKVGGAHCGAADPETGQKFLPAPSKEDRSEKATKHSSENQDVARAVTPEEQSSPSKAKLKGTPPGHTHKVSQKIGPGIKLLNKPSLRNKLASSALSLPKCPPPSPSTPNNATLPSRTSFPTLTPHHFRK